MLTDKAKIDFEKWYLLSTDYQKLFGFTVGEIITKHFWSLPETIKNAIVIDWLDSFGIYIFISKTIYNNEFIYCVNSPKLGLGYGVRKFNSRQEATIQAIIKANEIYNNNQKK